MMRWAYIIPRLVILGLIVLVIWISADPLLQHAIVRSSQSVTGSKVEIGQVKSSLFEGKVYIKDLAVADPRDPMRNMIQADLAYLQLDPTRLLHKELVIEHGHSRRVLFGVPRTQTGKLPDREYLDQDIADWLPATTRDNLRSLSRSWLDNFEATISSQDEKNLEMLQVSSQLAQKWPEIFEQQRSRIHIVQQQLADLQRITASPLENPLRDIEEVTAAVAQVQALNDELQSARIEMNKLIKQAESDRLRLLNAKTRDEQNVREVVRFNQFDADTISKLLLSDQQSKYLLEVVHWIRWFRSSIPNPETDFYPQRARGTDIVFKGQTRRPEFLIKTLELDGEGKLGGQHLDFAGVAKNLTTQPSLHDKPATFELRGAQGDQHMIVNCTIDRRSRQWVDDMEIQCPNLDVPAQLLGFKDAMVAELSASKMMAKIKIKLTGDQISGHLDFVHSDCSMHFNEFHEVAGGREMAIRLNQDAGRINQFTTHAVVSGTIENPTIEFTSDLGSKISIAMNEIMRAQTEQEIVEYKNSLDKKLQTELDKLDQLFRLNFSELGAELKGKSIAVSNLLESIPKLEHLPNIRR